MMDFFKKLGASFSKVFKSEDSSKISYLGRSNAGQPGKNNGFTLVFNEEQHYRDNVRGGFFLMTKEAAETVNPVDVFSPKKYNF